MNSLKAELKNIAGILSAEKIPYMVIGGLANLHWGEPRSTLDIDITISIEDSRLTALLKILSKDYETILPDPVAFAQKNRALPIRSKQSGVKIDLILSMMPYEEAAISRAVEIKVEGVAVNYCTAEDLILHKIISERPKDRQDVAELIRRRRALLDLTYLTPRVEELSRLLSVPEILTRFKAVLERK